LIVSDDLHTVLDQNDCIPTIEDQNWIGQNFDIDLGLLFYSGGSQYPACFVMSDEAKQAAVKRRIESQMIDAIKTAARMGIKNAVLQRTICVPIETLNSINMRVRFRWNLETLS